MRPRFRKGDNVIHMPLVGNPIVSIVEDIKPYTFKTVHGEVLQSHKYVLSNGSEVIAADITHHGTNSFSPFDIYYMMRNNYDKIRMYNTNFELEYDPATEELYEVPHDTDITPRPYAIPIKEYVNSSVHEFTVVPKEGLS